MDCRTRYPFYVMDFDHRDPSAKKYEPARLKTDVGWPTLLKELAKCDVVCANCHRKRSHSRRQQEMDLCG